MGYIVNVKCKKCNIDKDVFLGQGMYDMGLERVLGYCDKCEKYDVFTVNFDLSKDGELIKTISKCDCGNEPKVVLNTENYDSSKGNIECAKCGGTLTLEYRGLWD